MLTIGVDAHKRLHVAVAVDAAGEQIGSWRGTNTEAGWAELLAWAKALGPRRWGVEGTWNYGRGLAQHLVGAGETVYEINPRWTADGRRRARTAAKSDDRDARAVAEVVRRDADALPRVAADDECAVLDALATERDDALAEATRLRNQLHQVLLHLDPAYGERFPVLDSAVALDALQDYAVEGGTLLQQTRAAAVRRLAHRLRLALAQADELAREIRQRAKGRFAPLTQICGVDWLTAGVLAGVLGPGKRFASDAQLAAYAGVAPLEAGSAGHLRHRLNPGGNRRLNAILYRIALSQSRWSDEGRAYLSKRRREGKTRREAVRALKRHLARAIWRRWQECWPDDLAQCA